MTRLKIYSDGIYTTWWSNFSEYRRHQHNKMMYEILDDWGCRLAPENVLVFENDRDATLFLLRWA
jgi:hypothetical protein